MHVLSAKQVALVGLGAAILFSTGCKAKDTKAADEQAIRDADTKWSQAAIAKDVDAVAAFYTDDAKVLPPDAPLITGHTGIRAMWADLIRNSDRISWTAVTVEVASSGDLGYVVGTYELDTKDAEGKPAVEIGKMVEVFRKQPDGSWKACVDMFSADAPAAPAPNKN